MWTGWTELSLTKGHFIEKGFDWLGRLANINIPHFTLEPPNFLANTSQPPYVEFPIMLRSLTSEVPPDRQPQGGSVVDVDISPRGFLMAFALLAKSNWLEDWTCS